MNPQNLVSFADRTEAEHKKFSRMGGIASGKVRSGRRQLRETLTELLEEDETRQRSICEALLKRAARGDTKAFQILRDTLGEAPTQKTEISRGIDGQTFFEEHRESLRHLFLYEQQQGITDGVTALLTYEQRMALINEGMSESTSEPRERIAE